MAWVLKVNQSKMALLDGQGGTMSIPMFGVASAAVGGYVASRCCFPCNMLLSYLLLLRWFNIVENATARALYGKELQVDPPYPWCCAPSHPLCM